jgi:hypothetical protein
MWVPAIGAMPIGRNEIVGRFDEAESWDGRQITPPSDLPAVILE